MALPIDRDITLANGTQIPSTLLNNLQDMIIDRKHGLITKRIAAPGNRAADVGDWLELIDGRFIQAVNASEGCHIHLPLETGAVLTSLTVYLNETGAGAMTATLRSVDWRDNTIVSPVGSAATGPGSGGFIQLSPTFADQTQIDEISLFVRVFSGQGGDQFFGLTYTFKKP